MKMHSSWVKYYETIKFLKFYCRFHDLTLRKKCPYAELFWSVFSRIRTEYGEILRISPYSVRMQENTDQNNSKYWHFLRSVIFYDFIQTDV